MCGFSTSSDRFHSGTCVSCYPKSSEGLVMEFLFASCLCGALYWFSHIDEIYKMFVLTGKNQ